MKRIVLIALACGLAACGADPAPAPEPDNSVVILDNGIVETPADRPPCRNDRLNCNTQYQ